MKPTHLKTVMALTLLGFSAAGYADDRVIEIWTCEVADGMELDDVHEVNSKWVKYMNANVEGGDISSHVLRPIVGDANRFIYLDSFPNMASWTAVKASESDELTEIEEMLDEVADCSENTLHGAKAS